MQMHIDHKTATKEEANLYMQIIEHSEKLIKGASMNSEEIQQDVEQAEKETGNSMDSEDISNITAEQSNTSPEANEILEHILNSSPHLKSAYDELKAKGTPFEDKELLALAHKKLKASKSKDKKEIIEENEEGKILNPNNKGNKVRANRVDYSKMNRAERDKHLRELLDN